MTEKKQYTGRLSLVKKWLNSVTEKHLLKGVSIVLLIAVY